MVGGCCTRLLMELKFCPIFGIAEPINKSIDIKNSFAPTKCRAGFLRLMYLAGGVFTWVYTFFSEYEKENRFIYFGFFEHWVLALAIIYQITALFTTVWKRSDTLEQPVFSLEQAMEGDIPRTSFPVRLMWGLYSTVATAYITTIPVYWSMVFGNREDDVGVGNILVHGGVALFVLLDGLVIGRIPVRMRQIIFPMILSTLYVGWTLIHDLATDIGDGDWENEDATDPAEDSLYKFMSWSTDWKEALLSSVLQIFVFSPIAFIMVWAASLWSPCFKFDGGRRQTVDLKSSKKVQEDEESQVAANQCSNWYSFCGIF